MEREGISSRWIEKERDALSAMRDELAQELQECPLFPEVHGDRRLLRFLRRNNYDIEKSCEKYRDMLQWRKEKNVDEIRQTIVQKKLWHPKQFPNGEKIVPVAKGILAIDGFIDIKGQPISVEFYNYPPKEMSAVATVEDLINFHIWCMEYKMLTLEHMSNEMEAQKLKEGKCIEDGWGEVLQIFIIRDLAGFGRDHLSAEFRDMVARIMKLSGDYYPNCLYTCCMVNTPLTFRFLYTAVKQFLPASSKKKIQFFSSSFLPELGRFIELSRLPKFMGGESDIDWTSSAPIKEDINLTYIEDRFKLQPGPPSKDHVTNWCDSDEDFDLKGDMTGSMVFDDLLPEPLVTSREFPARTNSEGSLIFKSIRETEVLHSLSYSDDEEPTKGVPDADADAESLDVSKSLRQKLKKYTTKIKTPRIPTLSDTGEYISSSHHSVKKKVKRMIDRSKSTSPVRFRPSRQGSIDLTTLNESKVKIKDPENDLLFIGRRVVRDYQQETKGSEIDTDSFKTESDLDLSTTKASSSEETSAGELLNASMEANSKQIDGIMKSKKNARTWSKKELCREVLHLISMLILITFFARAIFVYRQMATDTLAHSNLLPLDETGA